MVILAAALLKTLPRFRAAAVAGAVAVSAMAASMVLHSDGRRLTEGARRVFDQLPAGATIVSDPRTTFLFRLYDGYRTPGRWVDWSRPTPAGPHFRVVNETLIAQHRAIGGQNPPPGFERPAPAPRTTLLVPRRFRLKALFQGSAGVAPPEEVRVYALP